MWHIRVMQSLTKYRKWTRHVVIIQKVNVENGGETDYDWILFHYPAFLDQNTIPFILDLIILVLLIITEAQHWRITNDDNCLLHTVISVQCCGTVTMIRIRVLGSVHLTYGSGSCSFCHPNLRIPTKNNFHKEITKTVVIKDFLIMFAWWWKDPNPCKRWGSGRFKNIRINNTDCHCYLI